MSKIKNNNKLKLVALSLILLTILLSFIRLYLSGTGETGRWNQWSKDEEVYTYAGSDFIYVLLLFFSYFGIQSAVISFIWLVSSVLEGKQEKNDGILTNYHSTLAIVVWNILSMITFICFILPSQSNSIDGTQINDASWWISNFALYIAIPLFMLFYFVFYYQGRTNQGIKNYFLNKKILKVLIYPIVFIIVIILKSQLLFISYNKNVEFSESISLWVYPFLNFTGSYLGIHSSIMFLIVALISTIVLLTLPIALISLTKKIDNWKFKGEIYNEDVSLINSNSKNLMQKKDWKTAKQYFKMIFAIASSAILIYTLYISFSTSGYLSETKHSKYIKTSDGLDPIWIGGNVLTALNFAFGMFTFQSNVLVCLWFVVVFIKGANENKGKFTNYQWSLAIAGYITVTCIIFNAISIPTSLMSGTIDGDPLSSKNFLFWMVNTLLHAIFPLCMIFYFVFWYTKTEFGTTKQLFTNKKILYIIAYPIFYAIFIVTRGEILYSAWNQNYVYAVKTWTWPYPFLNLRSNDWLGGIPGYLAMIIAISLVSTILVGSCSLYNWSVNRLEAKKSK
ncbi:Pr6Pr family membrane protein [Spiroplasma culicicola]|uniref:Transmembrane protein n=1 Tax=Spiroplasma culicicola AES-1 TaxID=1276246 RepID=W6A7F9_9MOLU|nr:hypothetical protein [Spiroplasma culicicola]AHI52922.1 hypothetical protein SCULI_v1c05810 [Spiroplasma culicicola AES-1]